MDLGYKILGGVLLVGAAVGWWAYHDHAEQAIGAQACIQSTTIVKADVVADNKADADTQALQLKNVVAVYDQKVADLSRNNARLAASLHDNALRQSAAAGPGCAAVTIRAVQLPGGQSGALAPLDAPGPLARQTALVLTDCDADHEALIGVTSAYNDWRDKMIAAGGTP